MLFSAAASTDAQPKAPPNPYKTLFYDNDFSYLDAPDAERRYLGDFLKQRHLGSCLTLDVGGEYRMRHQNEHILGRADDFLLQRTRLYADLHAGGWFRAYAEAVDAVSGFDDQTPRGIEENRFDALNLFGDVKLFEGDGGGQTWVRGGRQELLYGAQRLISPLDWSNTRRTFDGFKGFWRGGDWKADLFWTRPVPFGQHMTGGRTDHNFDRPDNSQEFSGLWATYTGRENQTFDFYYLFYNEYDRANNTFDYDTVGVRWQGACDGWLWEVQSGYQYGMFNALRHEASFYTIGGGRKFDLPWSPTLWVYYDWASGDRDPNDGVHQTFNQLFPLGHKYFGFMDIVTRQNIEDWNFRLTAKPHKKVKLLLWWHIFHLQQARDALYNAGGRNIAQDATGADGRDVGQELDFTVAFLLTPRVNLLLGYSHLYAGDFVLSQFGVRGSEFYYGQAAVRF